MQLILCEAKYHFYFALFGFRVSTTELRQLQLQTYLSSREHLHQLSVASETVYGHNEIHTQERN